MNTGLILPALVETGLVTYRQVANPGGGAGGGLTTGPSGTAPLHAPLPSLYTSVLIVYGTLALLPSSLAPLPQLLGWGFVLATFLNLYNPAGANAAAAANAKAVHGLTAAPPGVKTAGTSK